MATDDKRARSRNVDRFEMRERWATIQEIAQLYSMSDATVRKKVASGEWPSHQQGKTRRFSPDDQQRIEDMWESTRPDRIETREEKKARRARRERLLKDVSCRIP